MHLLGPQRGEEAVVVVRLDDDVDVLGPQPLDHGLPDGPEAHHDDVTAQPGDPPATERGGDGAADQHVGEQREEHRCQGGTDHHQEDRPGAQPRVLVAEVEVAEPDGAARLDGEVERVQDRHPGAVGLAVAEGQHHHRDGGQRGERDQGALDPPVEAAQPEQQQVGRSLLPRPGCAGTHERPVRTTTGLLDQPGGGHCLGRADEHDEEVLALEAQRVDPRPQARLDDAGRSETGGVEDNHASVRRSSLSMQTIASAPAGPAACSVLAWRASAASHSTPRSASSGAAAGRARR